ncbi:hypothetical protein [Streptomyces zhihengii]|uniref:Transposase n=1 Tax=Streptomyces zhihengii TaxID=1818004 RepID=A0ABS2V4T5_9ACTN|nr:hypothetical protein [Streptomyces zhihengii]MBM9624643.1 hypothetical protein [Streptomyces zhihengii]
MSRLLALDEMAFAHHVGAWLVCRHRNTDPAARPVADAEQHTTSAVLPQGIAK